MLYDTYFSNVCTLSCNFFYFLGLNIDLYFFQDSCTLTVNSSVEGAEDEVHSGA